MDDELFESGSSDSSEKDASAAARGSDPKLMHLDVPRGSGGSKVYMDSSVSEIMENENEDEESPQRRPSIVRRE
jgi:hypothetical protein